MPRQFKLGLVIQLGFGFIFLLMLAIAVISKLSMDRLTEATGWVTHTYQIEADLRELEKILVDAETGQRGFIFTGKPSFLQPYNRSKLEINTNFSQLRQKMSDNPEQLKRLDRIEYLSRQKMEELAESIWLKRANKEDQLRALVISEKGKKFMDEIRLRIAEMIKFEEQLLAERQQTAKQSKITAYNVSVGGTLAAIAIGCFILIFIARKVVQPINQIAIKIANYSTEIATTLEQQERAAAQQATAVNQTTTTMDELGASSQKSAEQAEAAATAAREILSLIDGQQENYSKILEDSSLKQKVLEIAQQTIRLSEQSHHIGRISNLVSELANQTNMLALNAAVEAVRAGEQGRGFSVVATEIRKLAEQSKQSSEKINNILPEIQAATNSTLMATEGGKAILEKIVYAIDDVVVSSQQISLNTKQQAMAIQQVVEAMSTLNAGAVETASGITQTKISIQNFNEATGNLKALV